MKRTTRTPRKKAAPAEQKEETNNTEAITAPAEQPAVTEAPEVKEDSETKKAPVAGKPQAKTTKTPSVAGKSRREKTKAEAPKAEVPQAEQPKAQQKNAEQKNAEQTKAEQPKQEPVKERPEPKPIRIPAMQSVTVRDFCDLVNQSSRIPVLNDQQIQSLTWEDAMVRAEMLEDILLHVLDYDIVLSDTNIWLELLVGHSSSHSDPRVNARLQFERQLESISRMMKRIGGKFMVMSETYEEIDRFATALEPVNYKDADWSDEALCRNVAARLAKRLMLAQQKENRLRIEGIGSESHHAAFADPAIIRRTVELFATGKKILLLTNDASVGIRSLGMCDDLQRVNDIDDRTWRQVYEPQRPMVLTMDDLKVLDTYMRQYHYLCAAAKRTWMQDAVERESVQLEAPLQLWLEGFRPGDRHERRSDRIEQQRKEQQRKEQERKEQERREAEKKAEQERKEQQRLEQQQREQERREQQRRADRERAEAKRRAEQEAKQAEAQQNDATPVAETQLPAQEPIPADSQAEAKQPAAEQAPAEPSAEAAPTEKTEEKKPRSHRGGRGRRSNKAKE